LLKGPTHILLEYYSLGFIIYEFSRLVQQAAIIIASQRKFFLKFPELKNNNFKALYIGTYTKKFE